MTPEQYLQSVYDIGEKLPGKDRVVAKCGCNYGEAARAIAIFKVAHPDARAGLNRPMKAKAAPAADAAPTPQTEWRESGDNATLEFKSFTEITNVEQLLDVAGVDRELWEVGTHTVNTWTMPAGKDSEEVRVRLWQVKATLKRRNEVADLRRLQAETLAAIAAHAPSYSPIQRPPTTGGHLLLLSPSDAHLGKLSYAAETGHAYDLQTAVSRVRHSIRSLTADALHHGLERIVLVVGNDLLQTDGNNDGKTTTSGTSVDVGARYAEVYNAAVQLILGEVEWLTQYAPVTVLPVPGNHDRTTVMHLGALLAAVFANNANVTVDARPTSRKYYQHGSVLLGFTHGNEERPASLPQIMAAEQRAAWAETHCREWITGHHHRKAERQFMPLIEDGGVTIRTIPALSSTDSWHALKGYHSQAAGQAIVYSRSGLRAQYHHAVEEAV